MFFKSIKHLFYISHYNYASITHQKLNSSFNPLLLFSTIKMKSLVFLRLNLLILCTFLVLLIILLNIDLFLVI